MSKFKIFFSKIKKWIIRHKRLVITTSIIFGVFTLYVIIGILIVKPSFAQIKSDADLIKNGQNKRSLDDINDGFQNLVLDVDDTRTRMIYFIPFKYIPILGGYYNNIDNILIATKELSKAGIKVVSGIRPIANSLGYGDTPVEGKAKLAAFVQGLPQITKALDDSSVELKNVEDAIKAVDPNYIPSITYKNVNIKDAFNQYSGSVISAIDYLPKFDKLSSTIQSALGSPTPKTYLMLFQNDKELRATGGFITSYAYVKFNNGSFGDINSNDIYSLPAQTTGIIPAPPSMQQYFNDFDGLRLRDANISPDGPTSSKLIEKIYSYLPGVQKIDGLIFVDTQFVASLLKATGPIKIPGYKAFKPYGTTSVSNEFTSENAIYNMEYYADNPQSPDNKKPNRKIFLSLFMKEIEKELFSAQKDNILNILSVLFEDLGERHIMFYLNDPVAQETVAEYKWDGQFPEVSDGDFFGLVDADLAGLKANFFIKRYITQAIEKTDKGYLKTVDIKYTNDQVKDRWINDRYKAWMRFYVPKGSQFVSITGVDGTERNYEELGYSVFDNHIEVPVKRNVTDPTAELNIQLKYYLPSTFNAEDSYKVYVFKQGGIDMINSTVKYKDKSQSQEITKDTTFSF